MRQLLIQLELHFSSIEHQLRVDEKIFPEKSQSFANFGFRISETVLGETANILQHIFIKMQILNIS